MLIAVRQSLAQDFRVESKTPPSVVGAGTFVSLEAKFTIALPQRMHGFRPLAVNTAAGRAAGDAFDWRRKPAAMEYYNERGNLTKREFYDYKGNLFEVMVYGYLDGARVASRKTIQQEYNPPPMIIASPPGATRPKSDPRYSNKFSFHYDDQKRLIEKSWFLSNGELSIRYVYKYSGNQREELVYTNRWVPQSALPFDP